MRTCFDGSMTSPQYCTTAGVFFASCCVCGGGPGQQATHGLQQARVRFALMRWLVSKLRVSRPKVNALHAGWAGGVASFWSQEGRGSSRKVLGDTQRMACARLPSSYNAALA